MTSILEALRVALVILLPAVAVALILLSRHRPSLREGWTLVAAGGQAALTASMVPGVLSGSTYGLELGTLVSGVSLAFHVDALGLLFALVASSLWLVTSIYNVGYVRTNDEHARTRYFASFAASLSAVAGVAFAANLLTLFVFYELLTVATYPLVTHKETFEARKAGRQYVAYTMGGGVLVFVGIVLLASITGTTGFTPGGLSAIAGADPLLARAVFAFLVAGFGVKAALMPLHAWLPGAMVAPTPVSGLLHAVAVVKSGAFGIARVVLEIFGPETMHALGLALPLAVVASVTTLVASLFALKQTNLKRLLAYSTVSQLSYIVLGLAVLDPTAVYGGLFHVPAHAVMKLALFLCAGIIYVEYHYESIDEMAGIGRQLPVTMIVFTIAAIGMIGLPLTAGFGSKFHIVLGSFEAGLAIYAVVLGVNGILKVVYFWPIVYQAFFETPDEHDPKPILTNPIGGYWETTDRHATTIGDGSGLSGGGNCDTPGIGTARQGTDDRPGVGEGGYGPSHRSGRWETSRWLLAPVVVLGGLTLLLGIAPGVVAIDGIITRTVDMAVGVVA